MSRAWSTADNRCRAGGSSDESTGTPGDDDDDIFLRTLRGSSLMMAGDDDDSGTGAGGDCEDPGNFGYRFASLVCSSSTAAFRFATLASRLLTYVFFRKRDARASSAFLARRAAPFDVASTGGRGRSAGEGSADVIDDGAVSGHGTGSEYPGGVSGPDAMTKSDRSSPSTSPCGNEMIGGGYTPSSANDGAVDDVADGRASMISPTDDDVTHCTNLRGRELPFSETVPPVRRLWTRRRTGIVACRMVPAVGDPPPPHWAVCKTTPGRGAARGLHKRVDSVRRPLGAPSQPPL